MDFTISKLIPDSAGNFGYVYIGIYVGEVDDIQNLIDKQVNSLPFREKTVSKIIVLKNKINYTLKISSKFIDVTLNSDVLKNKLEIINYFLEELRNTPMRWWGMLFGSVPQSG